MITIDLFQSKDINNLFVLFCDWDKEHQFDFNLFKNSIDAVIKFTDNKIIFAKDNDKIVGYAQIGKCYQIGFEPFYEIIQLLTAENARSQGIGSELVKEIEKIAILENIKIIKLSSQVHRARAHVFYERLGYTCFKTSHFYEKTLK